MVYNWGREGQLACTREFVVQGVAVYRESIVFLPQDMHNGLERARQLLYFCDTDDVQLKLLGNFCGMVSPTQYTCTYHSPVADCLPHLPLQLAMH